MGVYKLRVLSIASVLLSLVAIGTGTGCKKWTVHVQTSYRSMSKDAGTDADVQIKLFDKNGQESGWRDLWTKNYDDFQAGYHQNFYIETKPLGLLKTIGIRVTGWLDDDWHVRYIEVYDEARQLQYYRRMNTWLTHGGAYYFPESYFIKKDAQKWKIYVKTTDSSFGNMDPGTDSDVYIYLKGDKAPARSENELSTPRIDDFRGDSYIGYTIWTQDLGELNLMRLQVRNYAADHWHPDWIFLYDTRNRINYKYNFGSTWLMHGRRYYFTDFKKTGSQDLGYDEISQYRGYKDVYGVDEDRCT